MASSLKHKVIIVTEADSDLGESIAVHLANEQARLVLSGADIVKLERVKQSCLALGAKEVLAIKGSLSCDDDLEQIIQQTVNHYGQLDVLIPIAGAVYHGTVETVQSDKLTAVLHRNVTAIVQLCQYAIPHLKKTKGTIVVVSSLGGLKSFPKLMPHCVAASALDMFVRCSAVDLGKYGIRINSVCAGLIKQGDSAHDDVVSEYLELRPHRADMKVPLGGAVTPDHVACMTTFLASQDASYMNGTSVPVDGGLMNVHPR